MAGGPGRTVSHPVARRSTRGDDLRVGVNRAAMNDSMSGGRHPSEFADALQPVEQPHDCLVEVRRRQRPLLIGTTAP